MTLVYKARQSTLKSKDGKKKWFPQIVKVGKMITIHQMAGEIAKRSSLSPGDVKNVIDHLMDVMRIHLMDSHSVKLDGLGSFTVTAKANGTGVETEKEVNANQINGLRVRFTPSYTRNRIEGTTRAMFSELDFERYDGKSLKSVEDDTDPDDGGGGSGNVDPDA